MRGTLDVSCLDCLDLVRSSWHLREPMRWWHILLTVCHTGVTECMQNQADSFRYLGYGQGTFGTSALVPLHKALQIQDHAVWNIVLLEIWGFQKPNLPQCASRPFLQYGSPLVVNDVYRCSMMFMVFYCVHAMMQKKNRQEQWFMFH